jgi:hypothetical protein
MQKIGRKGQKGKEGLVLGRVVRMFVMSSMGTMGIDRTAMMYSIDRLGMDRIAVLDSMELDRMAVKYSMGRTATYRTAMI